MEVGGESVERCSGLRIKIVAFGLERLECSVVPFTEIMNTGVAALEGQAYVQLGLFSRRNTVKIRPIKVYNSVVLCTFTGCRYFFRLPLSPAPWPQQTTVPVDLPMVFILYICHCAICGHF